MQSVHAMIGDLRSYSRQHPRTIAAVIFGAFAALLITPIFLGGVSDELAGGVGLSVDQMVIAMVWQLVFCLLLVGCVSILQWHDIAGLTGPIDRGGMTSFYLVLSLPMLILVVLLIGLMGDGTTTSPLRVIMIILSLNALVGMSEEILFRGIIFGALRQKHSLILSIAVSSIVFGLLHFVNLGAGQSFTATLYQVINAACLGGLFCAILLQTNSLWYPILLHTIWNAYVMVGLYTSASTDPFSGQTLSEPMGIAPAYFLTPLILPTILLSATALILWRFQKRTGVNLREVHPTAPIVSA